MDPIILTDEVPEENPDYTPPPETVITKDTTTSED